MRYSTMLLASFVLWAGFFINTVQAVSCGSHSTSYYSTTRGAQTACDADERSSSCSLFGDGCGWGSSPSGAYFYFVTSYELNEYSHYYVAKYCAEGEIVNLETGVCETPSQVSEEDKKNLGCDDPCGPGASPMVGK